MNVLTDKIRQQIEAYLPRYPSKQAVTLPALHIVQDEMRCVPNEAIREIADMLDLSPAEVHDTMTFYGFFREEDKPLGKTRLWVCRSLACMLRGADEVLDHVRQKLKIEPSETTRERDFSLEFAECLGACEAAPCMLVNDKREGPLRADSADRVIDWVHQLRGNETASRQLIEAAREKGRVISFATEGTDERRLLQSCNANANAGGQHYNHIILQEDARKIEVLEEFLHGTQERLGIGGSADRFKAEIHVKEFMVKHRRLLGISDRDAEILQVMLRYK